MVINAMGFGIIVPVTPRLVMELAHASVAEATAIGGWLAFTFAAAQFIASPIVGNLSDRFGRRPVLLGSLGGFAIDFLLLALAPSLGWIFIARLVSGLFGATSGPAQAVIADIAAPDDRSRYFGLIGAAFGIGFVLGPVIGGLLGELDYRAPFYAAAALASGNFIYGWFNLPETLRPEHRRAFDWRRANPVGALARLRTIPGILPIALVYLLWQVSSLVYPMTWNYYAIGRFGWSEGLIGLSLAGVGVVTATAQILLLPRAIARWDERTTAIIGVCGAVVVMTGFAAANQSWMAFALLPLLAISSFVQPSLTAMMTRRATASTQGEVQGLASAVMAVGSLIAPLSFNPLLSWFTGPGAPVIFHGAAFALAALIALACLPILTLMRRADQIPPAVAG